ncbi:MAG: hypothetical protein H7X94_04020 [Vallitaleaceae bacterium]|nr:hypothetical protein [Vallitaleaceae bacterium]
MAIRPLDMQVMVPKLQEVAQMKQLDQQRANLSQQDIGASFERKNEKAQQTVEKYNEEEATYNHADAKDEGKNQYTRNGQKKSKKKTDAEIDPIHQAPRHKIDVKI